jgi:hypothetical protein
MEKVALARAQAPPDGCRSSVLSTTRRIKALEWDHHDRWDLLFLALARARKRHQTKERLAPPIQTKTKKPETPIEIVTLSSLGPIATYSRPRDYGCRTW